MPMPAPTRMTCPMITYQTASRRGTNSPRVYSVDLDVGDLGVRFVSRQSLNSGDQIPSAKIDGEPTILARDQTVRIELSFVVIRIVTLDNSFKHDNNSNCIGPIV